MSMVERLWYGENVGARAARAALAPASWLYGAAIGMRAWRFDHSANATLASALPVLSLGNITVGGTGKTPVAAWAAAVLQARGARPAVLLRGYGDDEPLVHARLNPSVPVIVTPTGCAGRFTRGTPELIASSSTTAFNTVVSRASPTGCSCLPSGGATICGCCLPARCGNRLALLPGRTSSL